jgi:hypothetical protein
MKSGTGSCKVQATLAASTNYSGNTSNVLTIGATKAAAAITLTIPSPLTYTGADQPATVSVLPAVDGLVVTYNGLAALPKAAGSYAVVATLTNANYEAAQKEGSLVIGKADPSFTWATPEAITYGTALSATQLNSESSVVGTFAYTPATGTKLQQGTNQTLSVTFTPAATETNFKVTTKTVQISVTNDAPVITSVTGPAPVALGSTPTVTVNFTDQGVAGDGYNVSSTWTRNGAAPLTLSGSVTSYNGTAGVATIDGRNLAVGVYTVTVVVTDRFTLDSAPYKYEYVVVYDPNGSFVTGGGWIDSPVRDAQFMSVAGRASFGFVSKYERGAKVPTGQTQFQFQAGNLNFHSTMYEWLTVAGARAQYKGEGRINNGPTEYGFMLTAVDGQVNGGRNVDQFRIKIWVKGNEANVVYDNQMGAGNDDALTTPIAGGNIVIQTTK